MQSPAPPPPPARTRGPGFLERMGVAYYARLARKGGVRVRSPKDLPPDAILRRVSNRITGWGMSLAFGIGAITTVATVWIEVELRADLSWYSYLGLQGTATILMFSLEFVVLFWIAMRTVYRLARLASLAHVQHEPLLPKQETVPNLLARAALEIPDPVVEYLGINPLRHVSKTKLILVGLLYKGKVFITNALAKVVVRSFINNPVAGVHASWVTVPITGVWNAYVVWKVAREARLRLFGYWLVQHIAQQLLTQNRLNALSEPAREGCVRAVACVMVLTQNPHPNMLMLLIQLTAMLGYTHDGDYDNLAKFMDILKRLPEPERAFICDLVCVSAALDGRLTHMERMRLAEAFGAAQEAYFERIRCLKNDLLNGHLHAAIGRAGLDFQAG